MVVFKGQFFHAIDAKSRLTIPAKLREAIDASAEGYGFVGVRRFDGILYLYTPRTYESIAPAFDARLQTKAQVRNYQRLAYGLAENLEVDRLGRVLISENTLKRCGITREVAIVGVQDHIEVWPRDRWEAFVDEQMARHDELAEQAVALQEQEAAATPGGRDTA